MVVEAPKLRPELTPAPVRRSKHSVKIRRGWVRDGETVLYGEPIWISRTKRRPWDVVAERRAANRRARAARKANR